MYSIQFNGDGAPMMALVISYCLSMLLSLGAAALILVSSWHIFKKLGMPGWKGIIPYYSDYMLFRTVWETKPFWVLVIGSGVYVVFTLIISLFLPVLMLVNGNSFDSQQQVITFLIVLFAVLTSGSRLCPPISMIYREAMSPMRTAEVRLVLISK